MHDVKVPDQSITLGVWVRMAWRDYRLSWNDTELDIGELSFTTHKDDRQIWFPDLEVYNLKTSIRDTTSPADAQVWPDGSVL